MKGTINQYTGTVLNLKSCVIDFNEFQNYVTQEIINKFKKHSSHSNISLVPNINKEQLVSNYIKIKHSISGAMITIADKGKAL